jgi:hypothetical protein
VVILLCASITTSWAQDALLDPVQTELPKVVVLPYRNRTEVDSLNVVEGLIRQAIANRLIASGKVLIVPSDEVSAIVDTLAPDLGYLTNERQAFRLGQAVGAEKVIFGSFTRTGEIINIKTYIVDCGAQTVHTIEQAESRLDVNSDQVGVETARVVQGQVIGVIPVGSAPQRAPVTPTSSVASSPMLHLEPWATLGATVGLAYLTYHYDSQASDTWDDYLRAVRQNEITRLYGKASDYLLARNVLAVITAGGLALAVHYWFGHDFGSSEQWSLGARDDDSWSPSVTLGPRTMGVMVSRRF